MSNASAQTASALTGDATSTESRRSRCVLRRRLFLVGFVLLLVVVGVAANVGPIRHYQDARARLEKVSAEVKGLEDQKAVLQAQLAKLSETGYLEGLAREELTYARADEELYIVTESEGRGGAVQQGAAEEGAGGTSASGAIGASVGSAGAGDEAAGTGAGDTSGPQAPTASSPGQGSRTPSAGVGAGVPGADLVVGCGIGLAVPGADRADGERIDEAGFLERMMTSIEGLF
jgi:cell division protein FtsB